MPNLIMGSVLCFCAALLSGCRNNSADAGDKNTPPTIASQVVAIQQDSSGTYAVAFVLTNTGTVDAAIDFCGTYVQTFARGAWTSVDHGACAGGALRLNAGHAIQNYWPAQALASGDSIRIVPSVASVNNTFPEDFRADQPGTVSVVP